jgi:PAS domain S-box-containing protein
MQQEDEPMSFAEEALLDRILELVTKQMGVAVTHCSRDFRYLWANQEYANWLQLPLDEIVGHPIVDVLGKEATDALLLHFERVLAGEKVDYEQETKFRGIGQRWISATYTPTLDPNGVANGWVAVVVDITERKRAEAALHETEERFRLAMNNVASGLYTLDLRGLVTYVNPAAETMFGWTNAELLGKKMHDVTHYKHPDGTPFPASECPGLQILQKGVELREHEDMFIRKDGSFFPVVYSASPLKRDAQTIGIVVGFRDDTQRREAERVLREGEERFRLVANTAPVMIWMSGLDKLCNYANQRCSEFTGRPLEAELGNGWTENIHSDDLERSWDTYSKAFDQREPFWMEYRLRRHDGEYRWVIDSGVPRFNADGSFAGYIGSAIDVTERKLAEEALRQKDRELLEAQRLAGVGSWHWDARNDTVTWSEELYRITGLDPTLSAPSFKEHHRHLTAESWERLKRAVDEALRDGTSYELDMEIVRPDGTARWIRARGEAVGDTTGRIVELRGTAQDITERRLAERELALANDRLRLAMESGKTVGWDRDVKSGRDSLFGDLQSMFGIPSAIYDGRVEDFYRYLQPDDRGRVLEAINHAMESKKPYAAEFRILRPDGAVRWVAARGNFYYSPGGQPERMLGMSVDITERKLAEEALRESEERFRLAAQVGRMFAYEWDVSTDVTIRSEEATNILGLADESNMATHQQVLARIHPEDRAKLTSSIAALTPENPNIRTSFRLLRLDGSVLWLERTGHALFDEQGRMVRMIGMVADVTERKLAEEALAVMSRKLLEAQEQERARIARELHDDVNQRLALLSVEIQRMKEVSPITYGELRSQMDGLGKRTSEISAVVQSLSHELHSSRLEYLGLVSAMKGFFKKFGDKHKVEIDFSSEGIPPSVPPEVSLCLFRVMQEGLQNALKHSGVRLFEVKLHGSPTEIHLTVRESGVGFDPELARGSPGLGLVSMQERVRLVKGTISITSRPLSGTEISVRIPLAAGAQTEQAKLAGA